MCKGKILENKGLERKEGKGCQPGKGGKDLSEEKGEDLRGGKGLKISGGERPSKEKGGTGGGKDLREERQKIWGKKALGGKGEK